jgi:hypothetical protein
MQRIFGKNVFFSVAGMYKVYGNTKFLNGFVTWAKQQHI